MSNTYAALRNTEMQDRAELNDARNLFPKLAGELPQRVDILGISDLKI